MTDSRDLPNYTPSDLASYVVCPQAWALRQRHSRPNPNSEASAGELRREWTASQELSSAFLQHAKSLFCLLLLLAVAVFSWDHRRFIFQRELANTIGDRPEAATIPLEVFALLLLLGVLIAIWDYFFRRATQLKTAGGLAAKAEVLSLKGSEALPSETFTSRTLGLSSRPDGIVREQGYIVPIIVKPLGRKVRDRHVIELLSHLRCVHESTNNKPPYGILILGKEKRRVEIRNTDDKQRWLEELVSEMRSIDAGAEPRPDPEKYKCKNCEMRAFCDFSAYIEPENRQD